MDARVKPAHDAVTCHELLGLHPRKRPGWHALCRRDEQPVRRVYEHRNGLVPGFTKRYGVKRLVYFEEYATAPLAIQREKNIKHWPREWKIDLIVSMNPEWRDLYDEIAV